MSIRTAICVGAALAAGLLRAQPPDPVAFEVASIRPARPGAGRPAIQFTPGGGLRATNVTLNLLIQIAYDIRADQLSGGPRWADSDEYDVEAKGPGPATSADDKQIPRRLQALLSERFHLVIREQSQEQSGYELIVAKQDAGLMESKSPDTPKMRQTGVGRLTAQGATMESFARFLSVHAGHAVTDKTGLTGRYDFTLSWAPDPERLAPGAPALPGPSLFAALQEQLGLKLTARKLPARMLSIVQAEKPAPN